jgi:DMSO/TMAO reductase YedYZ molybdopterin-dependent catalytic subunit
MVNHKDQPPIALMQPTRRRIVLRAGLASFGSVLLGGCGLRLPATGSPDHPVARFPQKVALRVVNDRPPCLETPWHYFHDDFTPNEAFYVRWHLQALPTVVDLRTWRLRVDGHVARPLELSLDDLRRMEADSVVAVNQCLGNSRSLFQPQVPGSQGATERWATLAGAE